MPVIDRPNVVLCLFDSLGVLDSGLPDSVRGLSTLSQLCSQGVFFNRTYAPCPESSPARASVFTGLDPCVHGLWTNGVTLSNYEQTFAQRLAQAGYSNYLAGRYQLAGLSRWTTEQTRPNEFTQMDWAHGPLHRSRQNAYLNWLKGTAPDHYSRIVAEQANPDDTKATSLQRESLAALPESLSFNHWIGECVGQWIQSRSSSEPFMAIAGFCVGDLHGTQPHETTDIESLNSLALRQADVAIGRILESLNTTNRSQDTVVVVASARGNANSLNAIDALHENAIRVPLLFCGAQFNKQMVSAPISTIDIAPTVLDIAKVPIGARMQGQSLLGVIDGSATLRGWGLSRIRKKISSGKRNWQTALCTDNLKLVVTHHEHAGESISLFNLADDPLQQNNLVGVSSYDTELEHLIDQMIDARCAMEDRTEPRIAEF